MTDPAAGAEGGPFAERDPGPARDAERIAGELAERIARWCLRAGARVREEAEDVWAEAQALRRRT